MNNLFSVFDPVTGFGLSLNWFSSILCLLWFPFCYWGSNSFYLKSLKIFMGTLNKELSTNLGDKNVPGISLISVSLFMMIMMNNTSGLIPFVFTSSSHVIFTLTLALPLWLGPVVWSFLKTPSYTLAHLVPQGTPVALMSFMVLIELVSLIIRPLTLSIRLMANMIAGHLLLALIGNFLLSMKGFGGPAILILLALAVLESAVALIQAFVFSLLILLYVVDMNTWTLCEEGCNPNSSATSQGLIYSALSVSGALVIYFLFN